MSLGKLSAQLLEQLVTSRLGAERDEVLVGPRAGTDAAIVRVSAGRVMAVTTDPLSLLPQLGPERSARLACHLVASDLWTTGVPPAYASVCLNLPPAFPDDQLERYLEAMHVAWREMDVAVVTGHTGRYPGCAPTIVGAATVIGVGDEGRTVGREFVREGDRVLVTKGCAIEAAALAATCFPKRLRPKLPEGTIERLEPLLEQVSVVADCRAAVRAGVRDRGVSLMHDATEGGVVGGLFEVALSLGCDVRVERSKLPLSDDVRALCAALGIDPFTAISEGTLIATVRSDRARAVVDEITEAGIEVADVGEVIGGEGRVWLTEPGGEVTRIDEAPADPWWPLWERATAEGWS